ncbi:hypothetical protein [Chryseobacterium aahli]|uniref:hypothetical protein n=1 Tax=Chryseobacterium aahli TaxID=1278643 RepID=UPI001F610BDA|nr:hypothetical protein [Chryseobacterium aahli]
MATPKKKPTEKFVKDIRQNTRRIFTAEQKILIVMEGLRAETFVAELITLHSHSFMPETMSLWKQERSA